MPILNRSAFDPAIRHGTPATELVAPTIVRASFAAIGDRAGVMPPPAPRGVV